MEDKHVLYEQNKNKCVNCRGWAHSGYNGICAECRTQMITLTYITNEYKIPKQVMIDSNLYNMVVNKSGARKYFENDVKELVKKILTTYDKNDKARIAIEKHVSKKQQKQKKIENDVKVTGERKKDIDKQLRDLFKKTKPGDLKKYRDKINQMISVGSSNFATNTTDVALEIYMHVDNSINYNIEKNARIALMDDFFKNHILSKYITKIKTYSVCFNFLENGDINDFGAIKEELLNIQKCIKKEEDSVIFNGMVDSNYMIAHDLLIGDYYERFTNGEIDIKFMKLELSRLTNEYKSRDKKLFEWLDKTDSKKYKFGKDHAEFEINFKLFTFCESADYRFVIENVNSSARWYIYKRCDQLNFTCITVGNKYDKHVVIKKPL
jgi:hypothetical protein